MVVIAIIGILVGLCCAVLAAREAARWMSCSNNLHNIGLAFHNYESAFKSFRRPTIWGNYAFPPTQPYNIQPMFVGLLPQLEQQSLFNDFDSSVSPTHQNGPVGLRNFEIISTPISVFQCPSAPGSGRERIYDGALPPGTPPGLPLQTWRSAPSDYMVTRGFAVPTPTSHMPQYGGAGVLDMEPCGRLDLGSCFKCNGRHS